MKEQEKNFVQCRNCVNLREEWCDKKKDSPDPDIDRECPYYGCSSIEKGITNYDLCRSSSIEELADLFNRIETEGRVYGPRGKAAWVKWLNQYA